MRKLCGENCRDHDVNGSFVSRPTGFETENSKVTAVRENLSLAPDEHFYGFGEEFGDIDKRGQKIVSWVSEASGNSSRKAYKNIPFFMSTGGYGVFLNTTYKTIFDMGFTSRRSYSFEVNDNKLDYYLIYGPSLKQILKKYTRLTGRPSVPPKWSFGIWMSSSCPDLGGFGLSDTYSTQDELETFAKELREKEIPCDVLHIDPQWLRPTNWTDLEWDPEAFPEPEETIDEIHDLGYKLCLWESPYVPIDTRMYEEGEKEDYFVKNPDDSVYLFKFSWLERISEKTYPMAMVDFTNPDAVAWYQNKHKKLLEMGVDVFKTDFGEYVPKDTVYYNGMDGREAHNLYPLLYIIRRSLILQKRRKGKGWSGVDQVMLVLKDIP